MRTSNLTNWCVVFFFMCLKLGDIYQAHDVIINSQCFEFAFLACKVELVLFDPFILDVQ